jgi:hypothetical protein
MLLLLNITRSAVYVFLSKHFYVLLPSFCGLYWMQLPNKVNFAISILTFAQVLANPDASIRDCGKQLLPLAAGWFHNVECFCRSKLVGETMKKFEENISRVGSQSPHQEERYHNVCMPYILKLSVWANRFDLTSQKNVIAMSAWNCMPYISNWVFEPIDSISRARKMLSQCLYGIACHIFRNWVFELIGFISRARRMLSQCLYVIACDILRIWMFELIDPISRARGMLSQCLYVIACDIFRNWVFELIGFISRARGMLSQCLHGIVCHMPMLRSSGSYCCSFYECPGFESWAPASRMQRFSYFLISLSRKIRR